MTSRQFGVFPLALSVASAAGCRGGAEREPTAPPFVFVVEILSRGKGVPEAAREAFGEVRKLLESARAGEDTVSFSEARIGLEGETRLRVECAAPEAGRDLYRKIRAMAEGVDLMTVREVVERSHSK